MSPETHRSPDVPQPEQHPNWDSWQMRQIRSNNDRIGIIEIELQSLHQELGSNYPDTEAIANDRAELELQLADLSFELSQLKVRDQLGVERQTRENLNEEIDLRQKRLAQLTAKEEALRMMEALRFERQTLKQQNDTLHQDPVVKAIFSQ